MANIKGTIKVLENKLRIKIEDKVEIYIRRQSINATSWITYKGDVYELELIEDSDDEDSDDLL